MKNNEVPKQLSSRTQATGPEPRSTPVQPPESDNVNAAVLARLFANNTNSYKGLLNLA